MNHGRFRGAALHALMLALASASFQPASAQAADHAHAPDDAMEPMEPMEPVEPSQPVHSPVPPLTDEDRAAVFRDPGLHDMGDRDIHSFFLVDKLEWQDVNAGGLLHWSASGWIGGDIDRLWIRTEGKRHDGKTEDAELQLLWGHALNPWWDVVGGIRQTFKPGPSQTWAALGLQGLALYNFDAEATMFVGNGGQSAARLAGTYDFLLTNRLVLQPSVEVNFYGKDDRQRGIGSGLSSSSLGLRLRYEIRREFAPYLGVTWDRSHGRTADFERLKGQDLRQFRWVAGVRLWF
ncbi:copper resistance protein B [Variovorax sp. HW608]|uniref:copper resistance protein B n=1 Tax=Variovorax sp. HW608 TaxID=1034889 RepID=UPI000B5AD7A7|nr:copper resistance protein B [Variovorax sp. HW608]